MGCIYNGVREREKERERERQMRQRERERPNQIMRKQKDNYLTHWKELTKSKLIKLECYLTLNKEYTVAEYLTTVTDPNLRKALTMFRLSEHSLAIEKGRRKQTWLSREDRLCAHCPQNEVETELHFLTSCPTYDHIRDTVHIYLRLHRSNFDKLPYLLGEVPQCAITAARFVTCCHKKRATSEEQTPL